MDIKDGHPGSIFYWFFGSNQGKGQRLTLMFMLYGTSRAARILVEDCLHRQREFDDCLGNRTLFVFFCPNQPVSDLSASGEIARPMFRQTRPLNYVYSGPGECRALPPEMLEVGTRHFRSMRAGESGFHHMAEAAADAHLSAMIFFQEAFGIPPMSNMLILCHRAEKKIILYNINPETLTVADLLSMFAALRGYTLGRAGGGTSESIDNLVQGQIGHAEMRGAATKMWNALRDLVPSR